MAEKDRVRIKQFRFTLLPEENAMLTKNKKYGNQLSVFPKLCHYIYIYFVHADTSL